MPRIDRRRGGGGFSGSFGNDPDSQLAAITRDQWQHFLDIYRPVEQDVLRTAMSTDFSAQGDLAGVNAAKSVTASAGTAARNISRSGATLTTEESSAIDRRRDLSLSKAVGRAENSTRRALSNTRANLLAQLVGIGRGVSTTAMSGLQSVADMAAQREVLNQQQRAQATSTNLSAAASAAAILIAVL